MPEAIRPSSVAPEWSARVKGDLLPKKLDPAFAQHPFIQALNALRADKERMGVHKKIIDFHINAPFKKALDEAEIQAFLKLYGPDVLDGHSINYRTLKKIWTGTHIPSTAPVDEVLQLARDFGLKGEERAEFLEAGYDYVKRYTDLSEQKANARTMLVPYQERVTSSKDGRALPIVMAKIIENKGVSGGKVFEKKPGTSALQRGGDKLSITRLRSALGVNQDLVYLLGSNGTKEILKPGNRDHLREHLVELLETLLIKSDNPLHAETLKAFDDDAEMLLGKQNGAGRG